MRKLARLAALALALLVSASALSEDAFADWLRRFNALASRAGAAEIAADSVSASGEGDYECLINEKTILFVKLSQDGGVNMLGLQGQDAQTDLYAYMAAALAASDEELGEAGAREALKALKSAFEKSENGMSAVFETELWRFTYVRVVMDGEENRIITAELKSAMEDGGFWRGLWGDTEDAPEDAAPPEIPDATPGDAPKDAPKGGGIIHKI